MTDPMSPFVDLPQYFAVLPLQIDVAMPEDVDEDRQVFYGRVSHLVFGQSWSLLQDPDSPIESLTSDEIEVDPTEIDRRLVALAAKVDPRCSVAILDLANPGLDQRPYAPSIDGSVYPLIAQAVSDAAVDLPRISFILLVKELPAKVDRFVTRLKRLIEDDERVVVIDDLGSIHASHRIEKSWAGAEYRRYLRALRRDPHEQLRRKVVKSLGWYTVSRGDRPQFFARQYYDLTLCQQEIYELLIEHLDEGPNGTTPPVDLAVVRAHDNDAFLRTVKRLENDRGITVIRDDQLGSFDLTTYGHAIIVVPVVASGESISILASAIRAKAEAVSIHGFAALSTVGGAKRRRSVGQNPTIRVRYCAAIEQQRVPITDPTCLPVVWGFPPSAVPTIHDTQLTSFQFWDLVKECGVETERDVPNRPPRQIVPSLSAMITDYGAWLVMLLVQAVEKRLDSSDMNVAFVCPEGEGNSAMLAKTLRETVGVPVVRVPREAFETAHAASLEGEDNGYIRRLLETRWNRQDNRWIRELGSGHYDHAVIFDDICVTGSTQFGIATLLDVFRVEVASYAALIRYESTDEHLVPPEEICCLYTLPSYE